MNSNWQVRIGHRTLDEVGTTNYWPFNGLIDEVRIYPDSRDALSAAEVAARYPDTSGPKGVPQPGTRGLLRRQQRADVLHHVIGGEG